MARLSESNGINIAATKVEILFKEPGMYALLSEFLPQFILPLGLVTILLLIGLFNLKKNPGTATWAVVIAFLLVAVFGNSFFASFLVRSMEWRHMPPTSMPRGDAIVVIAEDVRPADTPRQAVEVGTAYNRVLMAAKLYKAGAAPLVIVAGEAAAVPLVQEQLVELGVPVQDILAQDKTKNALDDAKFTKVLTSEKEVHNIILVNSAVKMDRSVFLYKQQKFSVIPMPVDYQVSLRSWTTMGKPEVQDILRNLMPNAEAFQQSNLALREYLALMFYRLASIF